MTDCKSTFQSESYYSESLISEMQTLGFTYYHGIDERTSIFFNKSTGKFIYPPDIQSLIEFIKPSTEHLMQSRFEYFNFFLTQGVNKKN